MEKSCISNRSVLQYFETNGKKKCVEYLKSVNTSDFPPVEKTFEKCIEKLSQNHKHLLKSKNKPNGEKKSQCIFGLILFIQKDHPI
jgi:arsenate reductase-like glutaredoxin family protein